MTLLGYYLGSIPFVKNNIEVMILAFVAIAVVPVAVEYSPSGPPASSRRSPATDRPRGRPGQNTVIEAGARSERVRARITAG